MTCMCHGLPLLSHTNIRSPLSKMESVSINDIKQGRRDKTTQLLKSLRYWHEKRKALAKSIGKGAGVAGPWMAMEAGTSNW